MAFVTVLDFDLKNYRRYIVRNFATVSFAGKEVVNVKAESQISEEDDTILYTVMFTDGSAAELQEDEILDVAWHAHPSKGQLARRGNKNVAPTTEESAMIEAQTVAQTWYLDENGRARDKVTNKFCKKS